MSMRFILGRVILVILLAYIVSPYWTGAVQAAAGRHQGNDALDFAVFYAAGELAAQGRGSRLYDSDSLSAIEHRVSTLPSRSAPAFLNPPFFAGVVAPISRLPFQRAFQVWTLLNVALIGVISTLMWILSAEIPVRSRFALVVATALMPQMAMALQLGQFSLIVVTSWLLGYALLRNGRDRLAGVALAPLLIKPELLLPVAGLLLWKRRYRTFSALVPLCGLAVAASIWIAGPSKIAAYPLHLHAAASQYSPGTNSPQKMFGFTGIMAATVGTEYLALQLAVAVPLAACSALAAAFLWRGRFEPSSDWFPVQWLGLTAATMLADPHLYFQDTALLFPVAGICAASSASRARHRWLVPALASCWLIGAMGLSPNVNAHVCLLGLFMLALLGAVVWSSRAQVHTTSVEGDADLALAFAA